MPLTVTRTLHYRFAAFHVPTSATVEQGLEAAVQNAPLAAQRVRQIGNNVCEVLNTFAKSGNTWCAMLHKWVQGQNTEYFLQDPQAPSWKVLQSPPPSVATPGVIADFLDSTVYFGVRGNHVVLVQSLGMRDTDLAEYFEWLFRHFAAAVIPLQPITLQPASAAVLRSAGVHRARSIRIKKKLGREVIRQPAPGSGKRKPYSATVLNPAVVDMTKSALQGLDIPVPDSLMAESDATELEVELRISRPWGRRDLNNAVMNQIGSLVAQNPSADYVVEMPDGSMLSGNKLKISKPVTVSIPAVGALPGMLDVFKEIDGYLEYLINSQRV